MIKILRMAVMAATIGFAITLAITGDRQYAAPGLVMLCLVAIGSVEIMYRRATLLDKALRQVEWLIDRDRSDWIDNQFCPWCGNGKSKGHNRTCIRQMALEDKGELL